ncbi:MAG: methyltransferase domain-containing protein [Telluria sp.]
MPEFQSRDPRSPGFWDERFEQGFTPWDRGGVPQLLHSFVARHERALTTLIPGCGAAYELVHLCEAGWPATAIDFSPAAVARARAEAGPWAANIVEADFFTWAPQQELEFIYERAFLCALPPAMWPRVAARWAELLPAGAMLGGFFYLDPSFPRRRESMVDERLTAPDTTIDSRLRGNDRRGPPFAATPEELHALLDPYFTLLEELEVPDSIPIFAGKERWQVWQRRA